MEDNLLSKLPNGAKKLWEAAYRSARSRGNNIETSSTIAIGAVKKVFKKQEGIWVKKHLGVKLHLIKHGFLFPSYSFELELTNNLWDSENQRVSESLLEKLTSTDKVSQIGDVDHERYYQKFNKMDERNMINQDKGTEGLYMLDSYKYENGSVKAIVNMNKKHPLYNKYLSHHQKGEFLYASAEFPDATIDNGIITDASEMLWSITDNPAGNVTQAKPIMG